MKIATLFTAAGLVLAGGAGLAGPAAAQERVITTTRTTTVHRDTGVRPVVVTHRQRYRSCTTHWRNHKKVRVCRWRYR